MVTCARHFEGETRGEIGAILEELGDAEPQITITEMSGILTVKTRIEPEKIIKKIHEKIEDEPWAMRYTLRAIPIFATVNTDAESIAKAVMEQAHKMGPDDTYRITVEKRHSDISTSQIITKIADQIKNKVSLEKYDWIILVEVVGKTSGVSILKDSDILSVEKEKRIT
ncbi:MAG TPA: THUMP domain-containing protein [Candidatus Nitrosotenuis sp.]|nr:THUMP domain-containing protein [Candidatus Nitrosotenuis sp.]